MGLISNIARRNAVALAAAGGSALVTHQPNGAGAVAQAIRSMHQRRINVQDFLPAGFNVQTTDCTPYIQKAINYAANGISDWFGTAVTYSAPRVIDFATNFYKVLGTLYIPTGIVLDLNKSTLSGSGFTAADNVIFETGYVSGGVVVSNIASANEVNRVTDCQVINGRIVNCYKGFNLKNFNENCRIANIVFSNCRISFKAYRCFYAEFSNLFSRTDDPSIKLVATESTYWFVSSVNEIRCNKVVAQGRVTAWLVDGAAGEGVRGMVMDNCGAEECVNGLVSLNPVEPMNIQNCYFEHCTGVGVDLSNSGVLNATIDNNWFGTCGTGIKVSTMLAGRIGAGNTFVSCTTNVDAANDTAAQFTVEIPPAYVAANAASLRPALPAGWLLGAGVKRIFPSLIYSAATGKPMVRQNYTGGLIDLPYSGDCGNMAGAVPFCDITYSGGTVNYSAFIDTKIAYNDYMILLFCFNTVDSNFNDVFQGRIFGTDVYYDRQDHGKTVAVSNVGGFVRLTIGVLNGAGGTASVTGVVRHA